MNLHVPVRIGSFQARGNLFLAPVAGYSDAAFRSVCADQGCDLAFTEMVSSEALTRGHLKTEVLLAREDNEPDYAVQLFGSDPGVMARAAEIVAERWKPAVIDVNCGCPVPKIVKAGSGSALMRDPGRIRAIVAAMSAAVDVPVTVKIRLGWDDSSINYLEAAAAAVEGGAAAVTLHARTRERGYAGTADRPAFYRLAAAVPVPVFASGDLFSAAAAVDILSGGSEGAPAVAGVMFARGAMGDPFIFARARAALEGLPEPAIGDSARLAAARRHLELSLRHYGERTACVEFRKQACAYLKGMQGGAELRRRAVACSTAEDYAGFFDAWERAIPGGGVS
ncbi:MAG: tRNA dihydrouridine synthase DusB [Spirochaetes bacterium]|nr:tRNA dihydrouridine synthase DusB [Spirochaetota bacterium]MBU1079364.1 tRNA dihydrouridine synthase DusB [Spirochaetota bacterium]